MKSPILRPSRLLLMVPLLLTPLELLAVDPGINQPGPLGNRPARPMTHPRDPGINPPGPAGHLGPLQGHDPGVNQPGPIGNAPHAGAHDRGLNQPGPIGNRRTR